MTPGYDLSRLIPRKPEGQAALHFVKELAATIGDPILSSDGYREDELRQAEHRLGIRLPGVLRDTYALIGRRDDLTRSQDRFLPLEELAIDRAGRVLVFRVENQSVADWGISLSDVAQDDPPVLYRLDPAGTGATRWRPFLGCFSLTVAEMILSEWLMTGEPHADNREVDADELRIVETHFDRLPLPDYPADSDGPPVRWYARPGVMARVDAGWWLWVLAATESDLDDVRSDLPGDWINS